MKSSRVARVSVWLHRVLASQKFFYGVVAFLVLTSIWVAISSLYPMAFDEDFHLGIIKLYADVWNPFSLVQPSGPAPFGALETDPSYLFHYLMSFPYRLLTHFTSSETAIVIVLRFINIALFVAGFILYRKVLLRAKVSPAIANTVLAVFVLIPVVPLLAGQINYDNLLILIVAVVLLLTMQIREQLVEKQELATKPTFWLVLLLLFASVVKYAFLPIAAGVVFYICYEIIKALQQNKELPKKFWNDVLCLSWPLKITIVIFAVLGIGLFAQRYVGNIMQHHDLVPDCAVVLDEERCSAYSVWNRDNIYANTKPDAELRGPIGYTAIDWSWGMWQRLFYTLAGPTNDYDTKQPLPIPSYMAIVLMAGTAILLIWFGRGILREYPVFVLFIVVGVLYIAALWLQVYQMYVYTAQPVAINGRYLIPLLPALGAIAVVAYVKFFKSIKLLQYSSIFATAVLILFLQGGSIVTYVVRSQPSWYWHDSFMQTTNQNLQKILKPLVIGD
jgi:hypothetical protein